MPADTRELAVATARPKQPYPGLRPFEPEEWSIFFGRESMVDDVIQRMARERMVFIHGSSGSGKSSLVRAGVLPKLARQHLRHGTPWLTCAMRPSGGPLWNLAHELARLEGRGNDLERVGELIRGFSRRGANLPEIVATLDGFAGKRLCILVDQFEELFRFERETSRDEAELFVDLIVGAIAPDRRRMRKAKQRRRRRDAMAPVPIFTSSSQCVRNSSENVRVSTGSPRRSTARSISCPACAARRCCGRSGGRPSFTAARSARTLRRA